MDVAQIKAYQRREGRRLIICLLCVAVVALAQVVGLVVGIFFWISSADTVKLGHDRVPSLKSAIHRVVWIQSSSGAYQGGIWRRSIAYSGAVTDAERDAYFDALKTAGFDLILKEDDAYNSAYQFSGSSVNKGRYIMADIFYWQSGHMEIEYYTTP